MLDTETKRRIDTARDILVGKVPDPKSQVEQITIALIYKFMDDMDKEAISFGGKATFFAQPKPTGNESLDNELKDFPKYAWTKIFDPKIGGHELLALYSEALLKLNLNPNIPQLFRDIFKNAYLPYRDPETLKLFLKTINEFSYDHSEKLGDAFEYLLSIMGSQGDAGQFRTPRHIIDFIVEVMQPKKNESILDPACGTAGFLISSYKHILQNNTKKNKGDLLTPDDRKKMMQNFVGYDISPDMVRLSLVNLYLHGFTTPSIYEYDTLTSEDKWSEYFDVIIANPPFMTPKGGIKPHKKFTVQVNRSEVLFVDYIAEHIHPSKGRAGIIVPEGIIFQTANAYKGLRKMLVEKNYLYAVVSLPAGIFNPYSGVKTSILLMDKTLANKTDKLLFVKIESDGFDLGAQRKANDKNDLTGCLELLQQYKTALQDNTAFESNNKNVFLVEKEKIAADSIYNLSIDRYRANTNLQSNFEMVKLGDICDIFNGATPLRSKNEYWKNGKIDWFTVDDIREQGRVIRSTKQKITKLGYQNTSVKLLPKNSVLLCCTASVGEYAFAEIKLTTNQQFNGLVVKKEFEDKLLPQYLFILSSTFKDELIRLSGKTSFNFVSVGTLKTIQIPLPPISVQQEIVSKIESHQKIIEGAKQVVVSYKPQIEFDPSWETLELSEVAKFNTGGTPSKANPSFWSGKIPWVSPKDMKVDFIGDAEDHITADAVENSSTKIVKPNTILIVVRSGILQHTIPISITIKDVSFNQDIISIEPDESKLMSLFLFYYLKSTSQTHMENGIKKGVTVESFHNGYFKNLQIPIPSLTTQQEILNRLEKEKQLVNGNKQLITIFEKKIKDEINKLWQAAPKEYAMTEEKLVIAAEE